MIGHRQEVRDREIVRRKKRKNEDNEDQRKERATFEENSRKVETSGCERAAGAGADLTIAHFQAHPRVAHAAVLLSRSPLRPSLASTIARAVLSSVRSPFRRPLASTARIASTFVAPPATATIRRFRRRSTGSVTIRRESSVSIASAVDVEEVPKHLADRAEATDLVHIRGLNHSAGYERGVAVRRAYADEHEIALTGERESLGDGPLFKQDAAVRRRVRHEGDGHHERLGARCGGPDGR